MRASIWLFTLALLCAMTGKGFTQSEQKEIARLKAELAKLQAENQQLKQALAELKGDGKPSVDLYRPEPGKGRDADKVIFEWKASGDGLSEQPVSLYYTEK